MRDLALIASEHILGALKAIRTAASARAMYFEHAFAIGLTCAYFRAQALSPREMNVLTGMINNAKDYRSKELANVQSELHP